MSLSTPSRRRPGQTPVVRRSNTAARRVRQCEKLLARPLIGAKQAAYRARDRLRVLLFDAAHHHAQVVRLDDDANTLRLEDVVDRARDLLGEPLLDLEPTREHLDESRQLAQPHNLSRGDIGDMSTAIKR